MLFSFAFEIGLIILGLLYVGDMYLDSFIRLFEITNDMEKDEQEKQEDDKLIKLTKHLYS